MILLTLLILIAGCGDKTSSKRSYGKLTVSALIAEKGMPDEEQKIPVTNGKLLKYKNDENFQAKGEVIISSFRKPRGPETHVIYWKNLFKDCETQQKSLKKIDHGPSELELSCKKSGLSIVHSEGSEIVSRVIEYASE